MNTSRPIWPSRHIQSPRIPEWFAEGLRNFGGLNKYGAPNYRVVWAMDAEIFENGNPHARKYPQPYDLTLGNACFWLERYATPEFFDQKTWNDLRYGLSELSTGQTVDILGPFPSRGAYIGVAPLVRDDEQGDPYEMLPLKTGLLDELRRRLDPGATKSQVNGRLETGRRLRRAKSADQCQKELDEVAEYYKTNAEKINAEHTRVYSGIKPSATHSQMGSQIGIGIPEAVRRYTDNSGALHTLWE